MKEGKDCRRTLAQQIKHNLRSLAKPNNSKEDAKGCSGEKNVEDVATDGARANAGEDAINEGQTRLDAVLAAKHIIHLNGLCGVLDHNGAGAVCHRAALWLLGLLGTAYEDCDETVGSAMEVVRNHLRGGRVWGESRRRI